MSRLTPTRGLSFCLRILAWLSLNNKLIQPREVGWPCAARKRREGNIKMQAIKATVTARQDFYRNKASESASSISIEETSTYKGKPGTKTPTVGEIPEAIDALIDNKMFRNKFKALIRKGHLQDLLDLAEVAEGKDNKSHWFARATRTTPLPGHEGKPTYWERSLKFLAKLRQVRRIAEQIGNRIKVPQGSMNAVFKAAWRHQQGALRFAVTAAEVGKIHQFGLFCKLAIPREKQVTTA